MCCRKLFNRQSVLPPPPSPHTESNSTPAGLASFTDYPEALFAQRMTSLGFARSKTDRVTKGDGDCALWAVLDGHNNNLGDSSSFERNDTVTLR